MDDILIKAAEIAEWSDRMSLAVNQILESMELHLELFIRIFIMQLLVRGGNMEVVELRKLITEWSDRLADASLDIQTTVLAGNGWVQEEQEGLLGWVDPTTNVHYLAKDAIALQRLRERPRFGREPAAY